MIVQVYQRQNHKMLQKVFVLRWIIMFLIGVFTAFVGVIVDLCVLNISNWKFSSLASLCQRYENILRLLSYVRCVGSPCLIGCLFAWSGINMAFTAIANFCVYLEPIAQGSGIPEVCVMFWLAALDIVN